MSRTKRSYFPTSTRYASKGHTRKQQGSQKQTRGMLSHRDNQIFKVVLRNKAFIRLAYSSRNFTIDIHVYAMRQMWFVIGPLTESPCSKAAISRLFSNKTSLFLWRSFSPAMRECKTITTSVNHTCPRHWIDYNSRDGLLQDITVWGYCTRGHRSRVPVLR